MARHTSLRRELPSLHQDGSIKFRIVLRQARFEKRILADLIARRRVTDYPSRAAFIRAAMAVLREKVAHDRAFYAVTVEPAHVYETRRVEHFGHAWNDVVYVGPIASVVADMSEAA